MDFDNLRLLVSDFAACFRFYRDVMKFSVVWGEETEDYAEFEASGIKLALFKQELMPDALRGAQTFDRGLTRFSLIFKVANVDEVYRTLKAQVAFETEPSDREAWGIRTAHLRDPDGNLIELYSALPTAA